MDRLVTLAAVLAIVDAKVTTLETLAADKRCRAFDRTTLALQKTAIMRLRDELRTMGE